MCLPSPIEAELAWYSTAEVACFETTTRNSGCISQYHVVHEPHEIHSSIHRSVPPSVCPSICPSICLSIHSSVHHCHPFIHSIHPPTHRTIPSIYPCVHPFIHSSMQIPCFCKYKSRSPRQVSLPVHAVKRLVSIPHSSSCFCTWSEQKPASNKAAKSLSLLLLLLSALQTLTRDAL